MKQLQQDPWETDIPGRYQPGSIVTGTVTKITNFGVFVQLEDNLEGLLHVSELAEHKVDNPEAEVKVGQPIEVRVLRVDTADRKIGLSRKLTGPIEELVPAEGAAGGAGGAGGAAAPATREELKGGTSGQSGPLFSLDKK
jgi:small subunit ribosomal protein S1